MLRQFKVDKSFVLGQIYDYLKLQIVYHPKGKLSLLNAELYQLELIMISFISFP
jgi:hypothetical protein